MDFNEAVDSIVRSQDLKRDSAYSEAYDAGQQMGFNEGYTHGVLKGSQFGKEVGFYKGFALCHKSVLLSDPDRESESTKKKLSSLGKLITLCEAFPRENSQVDIDARLLELQSRFKQVCSKLSINFKELRQSTAANDMF